MADTLRLTQFRPAGFKVKCIEFHPMQPWLAIADRGNKISVWNFESEQVVYESLLGTPDDEGLQDAMLQRAAEKEPDYFGAALSQGMSPPKVSCSGSVRAMKFCDSEAAFWQLAQQHSHLHHAHSGSSHAHLGRVGGLKGHRWLLMAIDSKVVMHDLLSGAAREIVRTHWDGKQPTALAFLYANAARLLGFMAGDNSNEVLLGPVLAVGSASGSVTLLNLTTLQVYAKLVGVHKAAVTALLTMGSLEPGGADRLLSASADGVVALWTPSAKTRTPDAEHTPVATFKAHDGAVLSMAFFRVLESTPEQPHLLLATTGADKKVATWSTHDWKLAGQSKPIPKGAVHTVAFSPHGAAAFGDGHCLLLVGGERAAVLGMHPGSGAVCTLAALETEVPAGSKKTAKLYTAACHPLMPHIVAVGANSGVGILSFDVYEGLPVQQLPLQRVGGHLGGAASAAAAGEAGGGLDGFEDLEAVLSPETAAASRAAEAEAAKYLSTDAPESGVTLLGGLVTAQSKGFAYVTVVGQSLWAVFYRTMMRESFVGGTEKELSADLASQEVIAKLPHAGKPSINCSASGRCVAVVWPEAMHYVIYIASPIEAGEWHQLTEGTATAVVWAAASSTFAALYAPQAALPDFGKPSKKKGKARDEELARQYATAAAQATAHQTFTVQISRVDEAARTVRQMVAALPLKGVPVKLHGGALLGVASSNSIKSGGRTGRALQFFSWTSHAAVGCDLVEPRWLAWDPEVTICALAYEDGVTLAAVRPQFRAIAALPLPHATSGIWHKHQLFLVTPTAVVLVFASAGGGGGRMVGLGGSDEPFVEVVPLASLQGAVEESPDKGVSLPAAGMRPAGPTQLLGLRDGNLWLADCVGQPFLVPLTHPGLLTRTMAACNDLQAARATAEKGLLSEHHDDIARFMAAIQPGGAAEATKLSGLSLQAGLALAIQRNQFSEGLRCLEVMASGMEERSISSSIAMAARSQDTAAVGELYASSAAAPQEQDSQRPHMTEPLNLQHMRKAAEGDLSDSDDSEASAESEGGTIDWDIPLKLPRSVLMAAQQAREAEVAASAANASSSASSAVSAMADAALRLAAAANSAGQKEVAKGALRVLARAGSGLPTQQVVRLLLEMARAGMGPELNKLAAVLSAPGVRKAPEVVALAAAVAPDEAICQQTLSQAGLVALAALYMHAWRAGNALQALQEWTKQLTDSVADPEARISVHPPLTF